MPVIRLALAIKIVLCAAADDGGSIVNVAPRNDSFHVRICETRLANREHLYPVLAIQFS